MRASLLLPLIIVSAPAAAQQDGLSQRIDPAAPRGAVLATDDVATAREDPLLAPGRRPALVDVAGRDGQVHPERAPLVVVHGIDADFGDLAPMVRRLSDQDRYQVTLVAYADVKRRTSLNGDDLAPLLVERFRGRPLSIVAHSMGGIVVRRALNRLAHEGRLGCFPRVRLLAVDTPWHGYGGPRDGARMSFVRPFMPDGYEDMRARSPMFSGDDRRADPLDRAGLFAAALPGHVSVKLVTAREGTAALDWTEAPLGAVPAQLARLAAGEELAPGLDPQVRNFALAVRQSTAWRAISRARGEAAALEALQDEVPRLSGGHSSVLANEPFFAVLGGFLDLELERPAR